MKKLLVFLFVLTHSPIAFADYQPGRTRASAEAIMKATQANGLFRDVLQASLTQFTTDGKGITKFILTVNGSQLTFLVKKVHRSPCGLTYNTIGNNSSPQSALRLILLDQSSSECEREIQNFWSARVDAEVRGMQPSNLELKGDPDHFMLSM